MAQARADLSHVNATIAIFEQGHADHSGVPYVDTARMFKRGEIATICPEALKARPMSTRDLAAVLIDAKGLDAGDKVLGKAMALRIVHTLRLQEKTKRLVRIGKVKGAIVWWLPA